MANRPHVPKFGEWTNGDETPYTMVFNDARKGRAGNLGAANAYDPKDNSSSRSNDSVSSRPKPRPEEPRSQRPHRAPQDRVKSRDDFGDMRFHNPASPSIENRRPSGRTGGPAPEINKRPGRSTITYENQNSERRQLQGRNSGREGNKPGLYDGYGSGRGVPMRPNLRTPDRAGKPATVPEFGGWDRNPNVGYTHIFDKVREDKHNGGRVQNTVSTPSHPINPRPNQPQSPKGCCFPWRKN